MIKLNQHTNNIEVFENADFISCDEKDRMFRTLVVKDGRIVFTGNHIPEAYQNGRRIDLEGRCVVPAFGDSHIHFSSFAYFHVGLDCREAGDFNEMGEMLRAYILAHPRERTVLAFGCSAHTVREKRLPQKEDLDRITDHPVMIVKYDGHAAVGNSAMIRMMPGNVLQDPGFDSQTGWFHLDAFYRAVNRITRSVSLTRFFKNLMAGSHFLARNGIGLVHAVEGVGFPLDLDVDLMRLAALGLPQTYRVYFQTRSIRKVTRRKMPRVGGCFATALDGSLGSVDAALRKPYDHSGGHYGALVYSQEQVDDFVGTAHGHGLQVSMHAIGDAAIQQALNAYEKALNENPREDHRHVLIHGFLMDDALMDKAAKLGIGIALQPPLLHWEHEPMDYLESILGDRVNQLMPLKRMRDRGLLLAGGSDAPCSIPDPIFGIHAACNHPNPDESVTVMDALKMYTSNCAGLSFDEQRKGTLCVGKDADFAVLDRNILTQPVDQIKAIKVRDLYLNGRKYEKREHSATRLLMECFKNKFLRKRGI